MKNNTGSELPSSKEDMRLMDQLNDLCLLEIALERMFHYDPNTVISQEKIDRKFGIRPEMLDNLDDIDIE